LIAAWRDWSGDSGRISDRIATSLGLFAGHPAAFWRDSDTGYSFLPAPRLKRRITGWRPSRTRSGAIVLFHGRIDNAAELASILEAPANDPARLYGEAVDRWGDDADRRIVGYYCAIVSSEDALRLARSPWDAPPLHYCRFEGQAVIASVPRVLLAAGLPQRLDRTKLADNLFFNLLDRERGWYEGARQVPGGSIVHLTRDGGRRIDWYDPDAIVPVRLPNDDDYVAAANELLAEAVSKALTGVRKPAVSLSGGLDSPIMADEILRQLPAGESLHSFTAVPDPAWDRITPSGTMGDERPFVEAFAAEHPRLVPHFTTNPGGGFDARWDEFFVAMGAAPNHLCNYQAYHGVWAGARDAGCDALLTAEFGNQTFSNDGHWGYVEYLLRFRWKELALALRRRRGDHRSFLHKLIGLSVLPVMPAAVRDLVRRLRHPDSPDMNSLVSVLVPSAAESASERAKSTGALVKNPNAISQRESNRNEYYWADGHGTDIEQAFEQIYGLRVINVPTYRPLVEFCMGLPTDQFLRGGEDRWLARRMGVGRLPERVRTNRNVGWHNADWHLRMTRRLPELRSQVERIAEDPDLASLIDADRMAALLAKWPDRTPTEPEGWIPLAAGLPRGILAARFISHVRGSNRVGGPL
jgi:asparagine synthase (glutamine-hydrolysing)